MTETSLDEAKEETMFDQLTATRRLYLTELAAALKAAGEALNSLADLEDASPVGAKGAWSYPTFLLAAALEAVTETAAKLAPPGGRGP